MSRLPDPSEPADRSADEARVIVHWIPLGAGGAAAVRISGRIYEGMRAVTEGRRPRDLYHAALEIVLSGERFTIENAWPCPNADVASRGVVLEGPVWSPHLCRLRMFRYEVRCWKDGTIPDIDHAVASPTLTDNADHARRILEAANSIPRLTWGRRAAIGGEMWTSNSVISYLLTVSGVSLSTCTPPGGGRAPGWDVGVCVGRDRAPVLVST
ncbi:MAG TPA: hypothetical protein VFZ80_05250 [Acidimicrobiia bacterium]